MDPLSVTFWALLSGIFHNILGEGGGEDKRNLVTDADVDYIFVYVLHTKEEFIDLVSVTHHKDNLFIYAGIADFTMYCTCNITH